MSKDRIDTDVMTILQGGSMRALAPHRPPVNGIDQGFGLVEVMVALGVLVMVMLSLLAAMVSGIRGVDLARANQQAGALANAELESVRSLPFNQVLLRTGDTTISGSSYAGEPLDVGTGGAVYPHLRHVISDTRNYSVRRWITQLTLDASGAVASRRVTVEVSWTQRDRTHRRLASTIVTNTRRGLPLPQFAWRCAGSGCTGTAANITRGQAASAAFGFSLRNLGARDTWNLTASPADDWVFYRDSNHDGLWSGDVATEPALTDTDGNGGVDTGPIEPSTQPQFFVAHRVTGESETGSTTTDFSAISAAQPVAGTKVVSGTLTVTTSGTPPTPAPTPGPTATTSPCTGGTPTIRAGSNLAATIPNNYSPLTLLLYNGPPDGDTPRLTANVMGTDTTTQVAVCNYSTDVQSSEAGRLTTPASPAVWTFAPTSAVEDQYRGTATAKLWISCDSGTTPTVTAKLMTGASSATIRATSSVTLSSSQCNGDYVGTPFGLILPSSGFGVTHGSPDRLTLRLETTSPVRVLYDAPGAGATLVVGAK